MKFLENKFLIILVSFIFGSVLTYFITDYVRLKNDVNSNQIVRSEKANVSTNSQGVKPIDPFVQMDKMHRQMQKRMDRFFRGGLFDDSFMDSDSFSFSNRNNLKIEQSEDDANKYIIISAPGLNSNEINIDISDGMVNISGEIKQSDEENQAGVHSQSSYISKFSQSFSIPQGVDESKVKIENEDSKLVIKFPKEQI